ncbi:CU044_5270 family protein [Streptomyces sp. NPDC059994]|uniref:CU044_5270 family protein n=1 Tax=Streptomyces sp. NPDC059994 TaxID=3347029 RepID=UPI0036C0E08B
MTTGSTPQQHDATESAERDELARLVPTPPYRDIDTDRLLQRKAHVLRETTTPATGPDKSFRSRLPRRRWAVVLASGALVGAVVAGVSVFGGSPPDTTPPASAESAHLLERAALAAAEKPGGAVRRDQYTYVQTVGRSAVLSEGPDGQMQRSSRDEALEQWTYSDGSRATVQSRAGGPLVTLEPPGAASMNSPSYKLLSGLPTEPGALLERVYQDVRRNHGADDDQEAFVTIGDLLRHSVAPPAVSASLYRAAAHIPGVVLISDAVDAAGRHGVAVARTHDGERSEWIFDANSLRLLGERTVLVKDGPWGTAGSVVTSIAIVGRGVVDSPGQRPHA